MFSEQLRSAIRRAFLAAASAFILGAVGAYLATHDINQALLIGLGAALGPFAARSAGEGMYDTRRADTGNVLPGDVTAKA